MARAPGPCASTTSNCCATASCRPWRDDIGHADHHHRHARRRRRGRRRGAAHGAAAARPLDAVKAIGVYAQDMVEFAPMEAALPASRWTASSGGTYRTYATANLAVAPTPRRWHADAERERTDSPGAGASSALPAERAAVPPPPYGNLRLTPSATPTRLDPGHEHAAGGEPQSPSSAARHRIGRRV